MNKQFWLNVLRAVTLVLFVAGMVYSYQHFSPKLYELLKQPEHFKSFIDSLGSKRIPTFVFLQVLQVLIAPLPGEVMQFAGGYVFGTLLGTLLTLLGIFLGSIISFCIGRYFGFPLLVRFISPSRLEYWQELLQSTKGEWVVFILFLIPGMPKDIITYIAGLTPIRWYTFFPLAMLGRFPGIFVSVLIGDTVYEAKYLQATFYALLAIIVFFIAIKYRKRYLHFFKIHSHRPLKK